ncbi:hypothetical protein OPT61_g10254 [Boeremia exigua]|uniref:Uncharacterized protein n=1 Tax=Boeremia exigua TaxID=749465 RepID=A0ACC2HRZ7_9PLEO|nr:hypothetical protein OPT61_g10254 [Boeremia exigua]
MSLHVAGDVGKVPVAGVPDGARQAPYIFGVVRDLPPCPSAQFGAGNASTHHIQEMRVVGGHGGAYAVFTTYDNNRKAKTSRLLSISVMAAGQLHSMVID